MADGLKDRALQTHYEDLIAMYATPGWKSFVLDLETLFKEADTLRGIDTMEQLHFRRGQVDLMLKIVAQPGATEAAYHLLLEQEDEE